MKHRAVAKLAVAARTPQFADESGRMTVEISGNREFEVEQIRLLP